MHFNISSLFFFLKMKFKFLLFKKIFIFLIILGLIFLFKHIFKKKIDLFFNNLQRFFNKQSIKFDQIIFLFFCGLIGIFQGSLLSFYKFYFIMNFMVILISVFYNFYYAFIILIAQLLTVIYFKNNSIIIWVLFDLIEFILLWYLNKKNKFREYFIHIKFSLFLIFNICLIFNYIFNNFNFFNYNYMVTNSFLSSNSFENKNINNLGYQLKVLKSISFKSLGIMNFTDFINVEFPLISFLFLKNWLNFLYIHLLNIFQIQVLPTVLPILYYILLTTFLSLFIFGIYINSYIFTIIFFYLSLAASSVFAISGIILLFRKLNIIAFWATILCFSNASLFFLGFFIGILNPIFLLI